MLKYNISKNSKADFEVVGVNHSGDGNDALYGAFTTLSGALDDVIQRFKPHAVGEIYAQRIAEDTYVLAVVSEYDAELRLIDLFKMGGRSRKGEVATHCGIQSDALPQEFEQKLPTVSLPFTTTIYGRALMKLVELRVLNVEHEADGMLGNLVTWYMAVRKPIEPPYEYVPPHEKTSTKLRVVTDVTNTYIRFHAYGFCPEQNMHAFWYGTFNSMDTVFETWLNALDESSYPVLENAQLLTQRLSVEISRMPLILELENSTAGNQVRMSISGITKLVVENILENLDDASTFEVSQIVEDGVVIDMTLPPLVLCNLIHVPLPAGLEAKTLVEDIKNEITLDILIKPVKPLDYVTPKNNRPDQPPEFDDYFDQMLEYPTDVAINPLPINTRWDYISSSFLNGFINYVTPICVHVIDRYKTQDSILTEDEDGPFKKMYDAKGNVIPLTLPITKRDLIAIYVKENVRDCNDLKVFQDDVLILARCNRPRDKEIHENLYMFFWFDHDVSDCGIGRFITDDSLETVIERFRAYSNDRSAKLSKGISTEIPITVFKNSWLSF